MGHYDDLRQAQAHKQRQEQMDRERLWEVNRLQEIIHHPGYNIESIIEEIREGMKEIREEIADLKSFVNQLRIVYEDE